MKQINFFAEDNRLDRLSKMGDPLEKVAGAVDFEIFRPTLDTAIPREKGDKGGRPPMDNMLMFKIMLLQEWYHIADDMTEYLINDRLSFQRFLGLSLGDKVPDAKTIWLYREMLKNSGKSKELFDMFAALMEQVGVITREGSIVDASFVDVPKQRNNRDENKKIKEGDGEELWQDNENKRCQKDIDARWTEKNGEKHFGYKDHVKVDSDSKMIVDFSVTDAAVHDSQAIVDLIDDKDNVLNADSAYTGKELHDKIREKNPDIILNIHEKGYRNKPLSEEQKASNKEKSKVRARVEHVFGHMTNSMGGMTTRVIGIDRTTCVITLKNLAYNLSRWAYLVGVKKAAVSI
ncbi:MAG: IS5 family transposase [Eubacteriales bacterium]|jgi:transposase, IS5 family|nr:IS5 family transposase [Eubacteriales bacterium]MDI9519948.1 IS5 family transposase [Bacillota bacterium]NLA40535.1 IS5 family transposase [Smithella sp.]OQC72522.1 MAG: Transposase DDE domain protein [Spirochaetes bacterium ADurb.Bin001]HOA79445.1 IS5 family transposase [Defluviitaleaceae bacterium]HOF22612.1 IS5 family transposase [Thermotogota bacterium]HOV28048.1 IS5 family transposase [Pseudobacteroides sp.]